MIAVTVQSLASLSEAQQMEQEGLEHVIQHPLAGSQIAGLDVPLMGPVIDVQVFVGETVR